MSEANQTHVYTVAEYDFLHICRLTRISHHSVLISIAGHITEMASSNPSKKRKYLSLDAKVKVIRLNEKGESARRIATELDVGKTQIGNILKMKDSILKEWEAGSNGERKVLHARRALYSDLNDKVYEWFCAVRAKNTPLTGKMLQEKAIILSLEMGYDDFTASNGWLHRFQTRHNIKSSVLSGEAADVSQATVEEWAERLQDLCQGYEPKNIFNADETGLFYRTLPKRSLVQKGDKCKGGKLAKERITVLLCASATGEKIKPFVIGKSQNPRSFKGYHKTGLGVMYEANKKAWMTGTLFAKWLRKLNHQMKMQSRKILLVLDNCGARPHMELSNVKLLFLPPNTTARLQPMDAGVIQSFKLQYRKKLLRHILHLIDESASATDVARSVTILDAVMWHVFLGIW